MAVCCNPRKKKGCWFFPRAGPERDAVVEFIGACTTRLNKMIIDRKIIMHLLSQGPLQMELRPYLKQLDNCRRLERNLVLMAAVHELARQEIIQTDDDLSMKDGYVMVGADDDNDEDCAVNSTAVRIRLCLLVVNHDRELGD